MKTLYILTMFLVLFTTTAMAAEKLLLKDIDNKQMTRDTQTIAKNSGDHHVSLAWWIPNEFWGSVYARDTTISQAAKDAVLGALAGISVLAVVQTDVSPLGAFHFYEKEEVETNLITIFTDEDGIKHRLTPLLDINPDLEMVIEVLKPMLASAMGNLGNNMHFFVLNDLADSSERLVDPYKSGNLSFHFVKRSGDKLTADISLPLDSLFIPRQCPNGKDAHISWKYCPWSGEKLKD